MNAVSLEAECYKFSNEKKFIHGRIDGNNDKMI